MKSIVLQKMKTAFNSQFSKRIFTICICLGIGCCFELLAQTANLTTGQGALSTVTEQIKTYIPLVQNLIYAIAGIVAVVGAINVYMKMNNGDQDVSKSIMMLVGACLFLVAAAVALPKFFGV